jgi:hypothetical protein
MSDEALVETVLPEALAAEVAALGSWVVKSFLRYGELYISKKNCLPASRL